MQLQIWATWTIIMLCGWTLCVFSEQPEAGQRTSNTVKFKLSLLKHFITLLILAHIFWSFLWIKAERQIFLFCIISLTSLASSHISLYKLSMFEVAGLYESQIRPFIINVLNNVYSHNDQYAIDIKALNFIYNSIPLMESWN